MLTVDFDRLGVGPGTAFIDVGAGAGRHSFEAFRRGADVVAFDLDEPELKSVAEMFGAMKLVGDAPADATAKIQVGDVLEMPYADESFDLVVASEILEHVPADEQAIKEIVRITKKGGSVAVTVPRYWPEKVCWAISDEYHANEGGHIRIYRASELRAKLESAGLVFTHQHHAHALHAPYWWLKCAVGVHNEDNSLVKTYHKLLVWDLMKAPAITRVGESLLNPVLGKSVAMYFTKP